MKKQFKLLSILSVMVLVLMIGINVKAEIKQDPNDTGHPSSNSVKFIKDDYYWTDYLTEFDKRNYVYSDASNLYQYIDAYKDVLVGIGLTVIEAKPMSYDQATMLGCDTTMGCNSSSVPNWIKNSSYWLGSVGSQWNIFRIRSTGTFGSTDAYVDNEYGVRPVITIATSDIQV